MKENKTPYDITVLSERLEDLRMKDGYNKITLEELSKEIANKLGEYISTNTLGKYQKTGEAEKMGVRNLITLANFYEVPLDYLFGKTSSKRNNYTDQMTAKKFGLSDKAMEQLENLTYYNLSKGNEQKINLINYIIENIWFIEELVNNLYNYHKALEKKEKKYINAEKEEVTSRYDLICTFEKFRDKSYKDKDSLWKEPKPYYLI